MGNNTKKDAKKENIETIGKYSELQEELGKQGWLFYDAPYKCARNISKRIWGEKIMDIGGGSGVMAKIINAVTDRDVTVCNGNVYRTGAADNEFDTVYTSHVLEHVEDPMAVVKESIRISKKRIIHVVPDGYTQDINLGTEHKYVFNRGSFMSLMAGAIKGMKNVEVAEFEVIPDVHCNSLICVLLKA